MENIYIRRGGKIVGPTSLDNITRLWQNGKFKDFDEVSFNQKNWHPLGEFLKNNIQETAEVYEEEELSAEEDIEEDNSSMKISHHGQDKAMWTITWWLGVCSLTLVLLGIILGFIFGFYPEIPKVGGADWQGARINRF